MLRYFREPVSGLTHLCGALLVLPGIGWLVLLTRNNPTVLTVALVYGLSTLITYLASASMHLYRGSRLWVDRLIRIDHAAIYLTIAGTYTPIAFTLLEGGWRWGMLLLVWTMAIIGIIWKLFFRRRDSHLSTAYYMLMGWMSLIALPQILPVIHPMALWLIVAGGAVYTVGGVIFALDRPRINEWWGAHEIWHICVMIGTALHFVAIAGYILHA